MNQSPNSLRDTIRIMNSNLDEIGIVEINGSHYVTEYNIINFMKENEISSKTKLMESLKDFNDIKDLTILDKSEEDLLLEDINPFDAQKAANGRGLLRESIIQMSDMITHEKYEEDDIDRYIKKCDDVLEDIAKEKKRAREENTLDSQAKFSAMYLFNIAKTIFINFCVPLAISKSVAIPNAVSKLFFKSEGKVAADAIVRSASRGIITKRTIAKAGLAVLDVSSVAPDVVGLVLTFTDYEKLLDDYERDIRKTRQSLITQKNNIERFN